MASANTISLSDLYEKYKKFVVTNHAVVGNVESAFRVLSYFAPGRGEHSAVIAELLYSASNLLVFLNDAILRQAANIKLKVPLPNPELCRWLSVLEHVEVFLEIAAVGFGGDLYRWIIIVCVQIAKAAIKFILLLKYNSGIQQTPSLPALKRGRYLQRKLLDAAGGNEEESPEIPRVPVLGEVAEEQLNNNIQKTFVLKRSGRNVRTLDSASMLQHRSWKLPPEPKVESVGGVQGGEPTYKPTVLTQRQLLGECLHISRPLAHLLSMFVFGRHSWKPFIVACGVDLTSHNLLGDTKDFNPAEREELKRRSLLLILYLLRSPFYDHYSKARLMFILRAMAKYIPGVRLVIRPLLDYLPWWQRVYFYVWMT